MEDNYKNNMVFGIHPVLELIRSQKEIEKVYIQGGTRSPEIAEIANTCRANGVPVQFVPIEKMNRLTRKNHQGVVAFICPGPSACLPCGSPEPLSTRNRNRGMRVGGEEGL